MADDIVGVDPSKPSIARVYDYLLGGQDHYEADRKIGSYFTHDLPGSVTIAHTNRQALIRAIGDIADDGIGQFIDIGSGLPTADNVHQVAQRHNPDARVIYVDNDPIVLAHGRALLETDERTAVVQADLRNPEQILQSPAVQRLIDFSEPIGLIFSAILHHLNDDEHPGDLVRWWVDRLPSSSQIYISHFRSGNNAETRVAEQKLQETFGRGRWRTDTEILALFGDGLEILSPGLAYCSQWRPPSPAEGVTAIGVEYRDPSVWEQLISCALARKP
ncbi:SAM-dependent methyltransferase [Nocardia fusca]|uniref:SAM-dependent methyltransferase n=1 Tax=Nocardia fusca TaxID=941183 RepID=UPI0007A76397|nr:SAM-dependent methyltransferase [Nocardia fusca]